MSGEIQSAGYLNTKQLMSISAGIQGVSEEKNPSIFSEVSSLDTNTNKTIDKNESVVSKIINLGNVVLNKIASMLGISTEKSVENSKMETSADTQNDSIIDDYFTPYIEQGRSLNAKNLKEGKFNEMITNSNVEYTFNAIIEEKLAQNVNILEENESYVKFDDNTELFITKEDNGFTRLMYNRLAKDGSSSSARLESDNNGYTVASMIVNGNRASQELLEDLIANYSEKDEYSLNKLSPEGLQKLRENSNEEILSENFTYDSLSDYKRGKYSLIHDKANKGVYKNLGGIQHDSEYLDYKNSSDKSV